jgi:hypothetical protein
MKRLAILDERESDEKEKAEIIEILFNDPGNYVKKRHRMGKKKLTMFVDRAWEVARTEGRGKWRRDFIRQANEIKAKRRKI